ncbi:MAG: phage terminase large subunit family protein, partial [Phycisphaerales bacterium]|nr:phage terminase large subunit family protein [Phycisphaerales bacterium]
FHLPWSDDHLKVIAKIEQAVLEGGLFAMAMPRGSGKTSLCEIACLWALVYGHREFVALIGADEEHAANMLDSIKVELESNDLLLVDFPEVCFPIQALEGIHQRAGGQLYQGQQTHIGWTAKEIVLPTIPSSPASGAIMRVAGITGRIRGMKHKRVDGSSIRPALVLIDDPQTDESARSPSQCAARERILAGAILGLAGPGRKIAGLMTLTVVRPADLADRLLDRNKHPQWQGERTKMIYAWPTNEALWARYAQYWREGMAADRGNAEATEFYRANRESMDAGADVAWPQRFHPDELSAIQHAMNLKLDRGEPAFWAEYQNEPLPEEHADDELLTAEQIADKTNGMKSGEIPLAATHLTMFIDVQGKALFWLVAAWESDFTGYVIDYGTEPDQKTPYFTLRDVRNTLAMKSPRAGLEGAIYAGLERLTDAMLGREWRRDDGAMVRIDRCLIDANWGQSSDVVYQFCRQSKHASVLLPSHGRYVGASSIPFSDYKKKRGDRVGLNWRIPKITGRRTVRHVVFDTNYWKSFVHTRLAVPMGDPGCLSLFGRSTEKHRLLSEHLTAEYRVKTQGRGRTVDEWKLRVDGIDNHWLDCLVGAAVAASMQGAVLFGTETKAAPKPQMKLSALQGGRR